jgi:hypothetical protein
MQMLNRLFAVGALICISSFVAWPVMAQELGDYYVNADVLNERTAPDGSVINRIYRGQKLTVYEIRDGWAQTVAPGFVERWVLFKHLSRQAPSPVSQEGVEALGDPRIADDAIPKAGDFGLSKNDVNVIWRGAKHMLDTGECSRIALGDKSISKPNTYYVTCEDATNHFFTAEDLD